MSKIGNGANRLKNARETFVEQLAHGRSENECCLSIKINENLLIQV